MINQNKRFCFRYFKKQSNQPISIKESLKKYFDFKNQSVKSIIYNLVLAAFFLALFLIGRFLTKNLDFLNGFSWQLQMGIFVLAIVCIPNFYYKLMYYIIAPLVMLAIGFSAEPFFGYLMPHYGFGLILFIDVILIITKKWNQTIKKQIFWTYLLVFSFSIIGYFIVWMGYSIQGTLFYNTPFAPSMIYNSLVTFGSMAINFGLYIIAIPVIAALKNKYSTKLI